MQRAYDELCPSINMDVKTLTISGTTLRRLYPMFVSSSPSRPILRSFRRKVLASIVIETADMSEEEGRLLAKALMPAAKNNIEKIEIDEEELEEGKLA